MQTTRAGLSKCLMSSMGQGDDYCRIYIAEVGISRSYQSIEESNTDGPNSFTRRYAAPEVATQEQRVLVADAFSLGCVYFQMSQTSCWSQWFESHGFQISPVDYHSSLEILQSQMHAVLTILQDQQSRRDDPQQPTRKSQY